MEFPAIYSISFVEYLRFVSSTLSEVPEQRAGQWAFNSLAQLRPDIANRVRGQFGLDPFYRNEVLPAFYAFVGEEW